MTLSANRVTVKTGRCTILDDISFTLRPGELVAILGPNGAGKTSLLKALTGEQTPAVGSISLCGRALGSWSLQERAQILSVLPQHSQLNFPFNVEEVVLLGRYPHTTGRDRDDDITEAALKAVDGFHLRSRCYMSLSGGEKQRVHLARSLAQIWEHSPLGERFLLLDEPTAALDLSHQHTTLQVAKRLAQQGVGVLVILHDLNLAAQYADRLVMLKRGSFVAEGRPQNVLSAARIQEVFDIEVSVIAHPETERPLVISSAGRDKNNDCNRG